MADRLQAINAQPTMEQRVAVLLGASVESVRRWSIPTLPANGMTAEYMAQVKDFVGAVRGWWPYGKMPISFRNAEPWKTKEELAEVRKQLAETIGVHVNTLRVLWRRHEILPLPPDGILTTDYIQTIENHPTIMACKLTALRLELAGQVGENVPTLDHLWRHGTIPMLPSDGKLTTEYIDGVKVMLKQWRASLREQKKRTAEMKTETATRNREAAQKKALLEAARAAGVSVSATSIRRWLRKRVIPELPKDGTLPVEYVEAVIDNAKRAKERHRENTRMAQNRPGVRKRKRRSQRLAARQPGKRDKRSSNSKEMWAKRKALEANRKALETENRRLAEELQKNKSEIAKADRILANIKRSELPETPLRLTLKALLSAEQFEGKELAKLIYPELGDTEAAKELANGRLKRLTSRNKDRYQKELQRVRNMSQEERDQLKKATADSLHAIVLHR